MVGRAALDLHADDIVDAALELLAERGLDAVSMRNVGARLGVSPVPLYARVGNKDALLDAMVERSLASMAPALEPGERWDAYASRWVRAVRNRLTETTDVRLLIGSRRPPFVEATRPLVEVMRSDGFSTDAAVQACRLLLWAIVGFASIEGRRPADTPARRENRRENRRAKRPGGDPAVVTSAEADELFELHMRYLLDGIERDR